MPPDTSTKRGLVTAGLHYNGDLPGENNPQGAVAEGAGPSQMAQPERSGKRTGRHAGVTPCMILTGERSMALALPGRVDPPKGQARNATAMRQRRVNLSGKADSEGSTTQREHGQPWA